MENTIRLSKPHLYKAIDIVCVLVIGLGLGGLVMYQFAVVHTSQDTIEIQPRPPALIAPQDNTAGKVLKAKVDQLQEI